MPGISFLFKKRFHPGRIDQQKKLFIAEETIKDRKRIEDERSLEVKKELEVQNLHHMDQTRERDARFDDLKFMYSEPAAALDGTKKQLVSSNPYINEGDDDEDVKKFKEQIQRVIGGESHNAAEKVAQISVGISNSSGSSHRDPKASSSSSQKMSNLEKHVGKRKLDCTTQEEQEQRFPLLKGAPVEGAYAQNIQIRHKPFNDVIRNVRCFRCGEWGHQTGDRECSLRDNNPHEFARRKREDPLTYMKSSDFLKEKQLAILRSAELNQPTANGDDEVTKWNKHAKEAEESEPESDPEAAFIATLTSREKSLLLKKLRLLESGKSIYDPLSSSDSSSSETSSSDSDSDTDSGISQSRDKKTQNKHKHKRSKKESSQKHRKK